MKVRKYKISWGQGVDADSVTVETSHDVVDRIRRLNLIGLPVGDKVTIEILEVEVPQ